MVPKCVADLCSTGPGGGSTACGSGGQTCPSLPLDAKCLAGGRSTHCAELHGLQAMYLPIYYAMQYATAAHNLSWTTVFHITVYVLRGGTQGAHWVQPISCQSFLLSIYFDSGGPRHHKAHCCMACRFMHISTSLQCSRTVNRHMY